MSTAQTTISIVVIAEDSAVTGLIEDVSVREVTRSLESSFEGTLFAEFEKSLSIEASFENAGLITAEKSLSIESTSETPVGGGGATQEVVSIATGGDILTLESGLFTTGTVVKWSTTGTLPNSDPQVDTIKEYYLFEYGPPAEYIMQELPGFTDIDFFDQGTGTHTLTEQ